MTEEEMTLEEYMQMREDLKKKRKPGNKYHAIKNVCRNYNSCAGPDVRKTLGKMERAKV